ncbi:MAG: amidohydrolase family protein, partial [Deltaproteobacteria bacterium]|nr:amidohydrolase family protein [Deltaproteobacteria bacterium]
MNHTPQNPHLNSIINTIVEHPIDDRFLQLLRQYGISKIYDCHSHVSSGRNDIIKGASLELVPEFPFSVRDINSFYDKLFVNHGIDIFSIVFDTPLPVYDMGRKNRELLEDPDVIGTNTGQRIFPFAVITPDMNDAQIQMYLKMGARGFKITPRTPSSQKNKKTVNEISLFEMIHPSALSMADAHGLPILIHLPQRVVSPRIRQSIKDELLQIAQKFPGIKIILAHLGQAQTPYKIKDILVWIDAHNLYDHVWMDISAVTVSSVLARALDGNAKLLYGTDIDFALTEQGRYVMYRMINGKRVLADDDNSDKVITALVSTHFGNQLKEFIQSQKIDLNYPMLVAQWEGILDAVDTLKRSGTPDARIKLILEDLFFRNAEVLLGVNS